MSTTTAVMTLAALLSFLFVLSKVVSTYRKKPPYPPGPRGWPLIGAPMDIPVSRSWLGYTEWGKVYNSDILHAEALGQHIVVLNDFDDAVELLEKRAAIYSDRPLMPLLKLMGWTFNSALLPYGDLWRRHRKVLQHGFRREVIEPYRPLIAEKARLWLQNLASAPHRFLEYNRVYSAAIITSIIYGHDIESSDDRFFKLAEKAIKEGSQVLLPGVFAVNTFPILTRLPRWAPGGGFHDYAADCKKTTLAMKNELYNMVKDKMARGDAQTSLVRNLLEKYGEGVDEIEREDDEVMSGVAATSFSAGVDTSSSALGTFFLAMGTNPDIQERAQDEISRIVGSGRLPDLTDRPSMPYLEAVLREVLRWRPPIPLGVPHAIIKDDTYKGYFIPKGSVVIANAWAMTRDEKIYSEPDAFKPERFMNPDGSINEDDRVLAFGFGRRLCVGRHLAQDTIWLAMAQLLATHAIGKPREINTGKPLINTTTMNYTDEGITHPEPFACSLDARPGTEHLYEARY